MYFLNESAICGLGVGLEPLWEPMLAVLRRSWDLCWRSWAALGFYVGGLGPLWSSMLRMLAALGPMLAVLGRKVALARAGTRSGRRLGPKSGPGPSGKAIWSRPRDHRARRDHWAGPDRSEAQSQFVQEISFSLYIIGTTDDFNFYEVLKAICGHSFLL